jgi:hypothetical protein
MCDCGEGVGAIALKEVCARFRGRGRVARALHAAWLLQEVMFVIFSTAMKITPQC